MRAVVCAVRRRTSVWWRNHHLTVKLRLHLELKQALSRGHARRVRSRSIQAGEQQIPSVSMCVTPVMLQTYMVQGIRCLVVTTHTAHLPCSQFRAVKRCRCRFVQCFSQTPSSFVQFFPLACSLFVCLTTSAPAGHLLTCTSVAAWGNETRVAVRRT